MKKASTLLFALLVLTYSCREKRYSPTDVVITKMPNDTYEFEYYFTVKGVKLKKNMKYLTGTLVIEQDEDERIIGEFKNGFIYGKHTLWHPNGHKKQEINYKIIETPYGKRSKRNGEYKVWYPNGQLAQKGTYLKGKRNGTFEGWYKNGQERAYGEFRNGERFGKWDFWYNKLICGRATLSASGNYSDDGKQVGEWSFYPCYGGSGVKENYTGKFNRNEYYNSKLDYFNGKGSTIDLSWP